MKKKTTIILLSGLVFASVFIIGIKQVNGGKAEGQICDPNPSGSCKIACEGFDKNATLNIYKEGGEMPGQKFMKYGGSTDGDGKAIVDMSGLEAATYKIIAEKGSSNYTQVVRSGGKCYSPPPSCTASCDTWSACSESCNGTRTRTCTRSDCSTYSESGDCNVQSICTSCDDWYPCSKECGGTQYRKCYRSVKLPGNQGSLYLKFWESQSCSTRTCCTPSSDPDWSDCSLSCGGGTQYYRWTTDDCILHTIYQSCNTQTCVSPSCSFDANPSTITQGQSSSLSWSCQNADSCGIDQRIGSVSPTSGSKQVSPETTTTYSLSCSGPGGSTFKQATVFVMSAILESEPSCSFSANPTKVLKKYGKTTLSWECGNADSCSIDQGIGSVSVTGSRQIFPGTTSKTYTLSCSGSGGEITKTTKVTVLTTGVKEVRP